MRHMANTRFVEASQAIFRHAVHSFLLSALPWRPSLASLRPPTWPGTGMARATSRMQGLASVPQRKKRIQPKYIESPLHQAVRIGLFSSHVYPCLQ